MTFKSHLSSIKVAIVSPWTSVSYMAGMLATQAPETELYASEENKQNNNSSEPKKNKK